MNRKEKSKAAASEMALVHPNAAAIDIGSTMHMAPVSADRASDPVRGFGTFRADLHRLADWFAECGVTTIVMESTSVYWIPIYELLDERGFEVFLVNARDAKHVPGRKTDVSDAHWLQRLHLHGLLRASFRTKGEMIELRAYVRKRERLLDTAASDQNQGSSSRIPSLFSRNCFISVISGHSVGISLHAAHNRQVRLV
jgi:transposase